MTRPILYATATSHLDTQWRWTFQDTICRFIPSTLRDNFALFEKYPHYTFSFEGAYRYMLAEEYFPEDFARLRDYVKAGRWHVCGSAVDAGDVNAVSPESLVRQFLYGNSYFREKLGTESVDVFLPDCFGFGWALPSVAAHCGLKGFSTSKLEWGSSKGIPFDVGFWEGPDGSGIIAAINPSQYAYPIKEEDLANDAKWLERLEKTRTQCGEAVGLKYFGLGDVGGAPEADSARKLEEMRANPKNAIDVRNAPADALFRELSREAAEKLPRHRDEFLLIEHGVGTYTSHAAMKRWNRRNELHADAAERASVIADWLGGAEYPREKLRAAWVRFLANQMHDILPGTSIPEAYRYSWNDELLSLNQFDAVLENALGVLAAAMDTQVEGVPVVVFNPLSFERADAVQADVCFHGHFPEAVHVFGPDGREVPSQIVDAGKNTLRVLFLAHAPSVGAAIYDVRPADGVSSLKTPVTVSTREIGNGRLLVRIDENGDIASIRDLKAGVELLAAPIQLQLLAHAPREWPAWTVDHKDIVAEPMAVVGHPAMIRVVEEGPVRATIEIHREESGSEFSQRVSLVAGSDRVEVANEVVWNTYGAMLKAAFPLAVANAKAVYDLGLGTIERGNNHERLYEVPAQQWAAIVQPDGLRGVAILSDSKYGWDKPADNVLRHTLLATPGPTGFHCFLGGAGWDDKFEDQMALDFGHHRFAFAIRGFSGDWRSGVRESAAELNQPLAASSVRAHGGPLGKTFGFAHCSSRGVAIAALKKAEAGDEIIVRVQEQHDRAHQGVALTLAEPILSAREVNGQEQAIGAATVEEGRLVFDIKANQPRAFAIRVRGSGVHATTPKCAAVELPYNLDGISANANRQDGDMDGRGHSLPAELMMEGHMAEGIAFRFGPMGYREKNVVACRGQEIALPEGNFNRLYLLAASVAGGLEAAFMIDGVAHKRLVPDWSEPIGQWDTRVKDGCYVEDLEELKRGYFKRTPVGFVATHRHSRAANADEAYEYAYFFKIAFDLAPGVRELHLPDDTRLRVLAATVASESRDFLNLPDPS